MGASETRSLARSHVQPVDAGAASATTCAHCRRSQFVSGFSGAERRRVCLEIHAVQRLLQYGEAGSEPLQKQAWTAEQVR